MDVGKSDKWMSENPTLNKKIEQEGLWAQGNESDMYLGKGDEPVVDNADDLAESCRFDDCPPLGRPCPMCGRAAAAARVKDANDYAMAAGLPALARELADFLDRNG